MKRIVLNSFLILSILDATGQTIFPAEHVAPAQYNTGNVRVSVLSRSKHQMTTNFLFEPGSRNSWHYHPNATQVLMVIDGEGYYQEEGTPKRLIKKGDVIVTAPNVIHWNGATPNHFVECMTVSDIVEGEEHVVQLRKVSDEEFTQSVENELLVRIAEIEVYPQYITSYLEHATDIEKASLESEPGVVCLFPCQISGESNKIRILEIYRSQDAYQSHITTSHFLRYKKETNHMVKSLKLIDMTPLDKENIKKIFKRL